MTTPKKNNAIVVIPRLQRTSARLFGRGNNSHNSPLAEKSKMGPVLLKKEKHTKAQQDLHPTGSKRKVAVITSDEDSTSDSESKSLSNENAHNESDEKETTPENQSGDDITLVNLVKIVKKGKEPFTTPENQKVLKKQKVFLSSSSIESSGDGPPSVSDNLRGNTPVPGPSPPFSDPTHRDHDGILGSDAMLKVTRSHFAESWMKDDLELSPILDANHQDAFPELMESYKEAQKHLPARLLVKGRIQEDRIVKLADLQVNFPETWEKVRERVCQVLGFSHSNLYINPSRAGSWHVSVNERHNVVLADQPLYQAVFLTVISVESCQLVTPNVVQMRDGSALRVRQIKGYPIYQDRRIMEGYFGEVYDFKAMYANIWIGSYIFQSRWENVNSTSKSTGRQNGPGRLTQNNFFSRRPSSSSPAVGSSSSQGSSDSGRGIAFTRPTANELALDFETPVPIFDATDDSIQAFEDVLQSIELLPRREADLPKDSIALVAYTVKKYAKKDVTAKKENPTDNDIFNDTLSFNVRWVAALGDESGE